VPPLTSLLIVGVTLILTALIALRMLHTGWRIRH